MHVIRWIILATTKATLNYLGLGILGDIVFDVGEKVIEGAAPSGTPPDSEQRDIQFTGLPHALLRAALLVALGSVLGILIFAPTFVVIGFLGYALAGLMGWFIKAIAVLLVVVGAALLLSLTCSTSGNRQIMFWLSGGAVAGLFVMFAGSGLIHNSSTGVIFTVIVVLATSAIVLSHSPYISLPSDDRERTKWTCAAGCVACCLLLAISAWESPTVSLVGEWELVSEEYYKGTQLHFTRSGTVVCKEKRRSEQEFGSEVAAKYWVEGGALVISSGNPFRNSLSYDIDLISEDGFILGDDRGKLFGMFSVLEGRWRRLK